MNILLTNDDGIHAEGLWALYRQFEKSHSVVVVAPDRERSAVSHGITLHKPLRSSRVQINGYSGYAVNGTPADCIKLAVMEILKFKPDLVVAGINSGANVGVNLNYSGTVSAAKEAALYGVPAIAVSLYGNSSRHFNEAAVFIRNLAEKVMENKLPFGTFLNVNIPNMALDQTRGIRISRQGIKLFSEYFDKRTDPQNRVYYWQSCQSGQNREDPDADSSVLCENYISITPVKCDMTDYDFMESLKSWKIRLNGPEGV